MTPATTTRSASGPGTGAGTRASATPPFGRCRLAALLDGRPGDWTKPLGEDAVAQAAVADPDRVAAEQREHGADDAGAGEDHLGAVRLEPDDLATLVGGATGVELDLAVDLVAVEHAALDDVRVIRDECVLDRGEVRDGAAHADDRVGTRAAAEGCELGGDPGARGGERLVGHHAVEAVALGDAHRADVHAEALVDAVAVPERELRAAAARVEDDRRARCEIGPEAALRGKGREGRLLLAGDDLEATPVRASTASIRSAAFGA